MIYKYLNLTFPKLDYFLFSETYFSAIVFHLSRQHSSCGSSQTQGSTHYSPYLYPLQLIVQQVLSLMSSHSHTAGSKVSEIFLGFLLPGSTTRTVWQDLT